jgi:hypothetical protein
MTSPNPPAAESLLHRFSHAVLLLFTLGGGCAHTPEASPPSEKPPITIAVMGFGGTNEKASDAEGGCVVALLEAGYRVVDRSRIIASVPNENDVDYTNIGRVLGADLILDGGWTRNSGAAPRHMESRLISTHSANVLGTTQDKAHEGPGRTIGRKICRDLIAQLP